MATQNVSNFNASQFSGRSLVSIDDLQRPEIDQILELTGHFKEIYERGGSCNNLSGKLMAPLFFEPSTRTQGSFESAMMRMGGAVLNISDPNTFSSVTKGETLGDTFKVVSGQADIIVVRHKEVGTAALAAEKSKVPVINGGDGENEHPSQALLDLFTIQSELGAIEGKTITMIGDLRFGRTVHSLSKVLAKYDGVTVNYVSPDDLKFPEALKTDLKGKGLLQREHNNLNAVLAESDVVYVTRVQEERFTDIEIKKTIESVKNEYRIDSEVMKKAKNDMILMHPLPRVWEIAVEVDDDPRAAYFRQADNGIYTRMSILALLLGRAG